MFDIYTVAPSLLVRPARPDDLDEIDGMRQLAIERLLLPSVSPDDGRALIPFMPFDPRLVADGTYFVAEVGGRIAAGGGWSRRAALVGGPHGVASERLRDSETEPAAIRAMYTHPDFARAGLGSVLLATAEAAARLAGFRSATLIATPAGEKLYLARGWRIEDHLLLGPEPGPKVEVSVMSRCLDGARPAVATSRECAE